MEQYTQEQIDNMTAEDLIEGVYKIYEIPDLFTRESLTFRLAARARKLGVLGQFRRLLKAAETDEKKSAALYTSMNSRANIGIQLTYGQDGKPAQTIKNYLTIMRNDDYFITFRYNLFKLCAEYTENMKVKRWGDGEDSAAIDYIESKYGLCYEPKYQHAMRIFKGERSYHPIRDYVDSLQWDGVPRIKNFLSRWMGCEDTPYHQEVSRLIFAGGIHRLYDSGCKFDIVPVLIGTRQGEGKSSLVRMLAIKDEWYGELTDFEGARGIEAIQGKWICEIGELLAMVRAKETESIKAYTSRQVDSYRAPYDRHVSSLPRQCIFVGTTNKERFLTDKTGNRRFFPVKVNMQGYDLFAREKECREYIIQCWAEAKAHYNDPLTSLVEDRKLLDVILQKQHASEEDDWREGMICAYLESKHGGDCVCALELWQEGLGMGCFSRPTLSESNAISLIMQRMINWKRGESPIRFSKYGVQRYWTKIEKQEELPF
jgi:predicted P-loop ATPase